MRLGDTKCVVCNEPFKLTTWNKAHCSKKCTQQSIGMFSQKEGEIPIPSATIGAIAELVVCEDLLKKGFNVFRSVSPSSNFDLIGFKDDKMTSFEVRTGYHLHSGSISFPKKEKDKAQHYAVYVHVENKIYYFPPLAI